MLGDGYSEGRAEYGCRRDKAFHQGLFLTGTSVSRLCSVKGGNDARCMEYDVVIPTLEQLNITTVAIYTKLYWNINNYLPASPWDSWDQNARGRSGRNWQSVKKM